jgi:hypothetical protein
MTDFSVFMLSNDELPVRSGPGVSRSMPGAATSMYYLRIKMPHGTPMTVTMKAESLTLGTLPMPWGCSVPS